jgi:hypothetical protein
VVVVGVEHRYASTYRQRCQRIHGWHDTRGRRRHAAKGRRAVGVAAGAERVHAMELLILILISVVVVVVVVV